MRPSYTSCAEHFRSQKSPRQYKWLPLAAETPTPTMIPGDSPFLRLPTEIRLQIYSLLVLPHEHNDLLPSYEKISASAQDCFDYDRTMPGTTRPATADIHNPTLRLRTIDPLRYDQRSGRVQEQQVRSAYSVHGDRFRARCLGTTYHCVNNSTINEGIGILGTNKQIHSEVAELLYSHYKFDFDTHVEAIVPFLQDLTPFSRSCIRSIRIVKRPLVFEKEFDRCEWANAMQYLSQPECGMNLRSLDLGIVAGRPGLRGWDLVPAYTASDFRTLKSMEGMEWLRELLEIKGLQELNLSTIVEHCPPATNSMAMAGYIRFSASIEHGLSKFLRSEMLA